VSKKAILALADGVVFHGSALGAEGLTCGELVFNTAMTGYQEIISDPSYTQQIVTLTYPHIGNTGMNLEDEESHQPRLAGLVIKQATQLNTHYRSTQTLQSYLLAHHIIGISGIDTRALTHHLREHGAQNACIMSGDLLDIDFAIMQAKKAPSLQGLNLTKQVTTKKPYRWLEKTPFFDAPSDIRYQNKPRVLVYDFGVKQNILRLLANLNCEVIVLPADTSVEEALSYFPDGIVFSNGPGDPAACDALIHTVKTFLEKRIPLLGICLGHQLLALAAGAKTIKMKFGHHGANHPVIDVNTQKIMITSQNHGFTVDETDLPSTIIVTHRSLFDNTIQGIRIKDANAFGFQGHPEASPGPHDLIELFQLFIDTFSLTR
jgi:carbamoyl-phosphate synthase small subunit